MDEKKTLKQLLVSIDNIARNLSSGAGYVTLTATMDDGGRIAYTINCVRQIRTGEMVRANLNEQSERDIAMRNDGFCSKVRTYEEDTFGQLLIGKLISAYYIIDRIILITPTRSVELYKDQYDAYAKGDDDIIHQDVRGLASRSIRETYNLYKDAETRNMPLWQKGVAFFTGAGSPSSRTSATARRMSSATAAARTSATAAAPTGRRSTATPTAPTGRRSSTATAPARRRSSVSAASPAKRRSSAAAAAPARRRSSAAAATPARRRSSAAATAAATASKKTGV
jgi:hypothetical protein